MGVERPGASCSAIANARTKDALRVPTIEGVASPAVCIAWQAQCARDRILLGALSAATISIKGDGVVVRVERPVGG